MANFEVYAGRYDGQDLNCKYGSHPFETLDEAVADVLTTAQHYPWFNVWVDDPNYVPHVLFVWPDGSWMDSNDWSESEHQYKGDDFFSVNIDSPQNG